MTIECRKTELPEIAHLRDIYRHVMHCQVTKDSLHIRPGWVTSYLLTLDGATAGYGSVAHAGPWKDKPTIFEFFVLPTLRHRTIRLFWQFVDAAGTRSLEAQTNDPYLGILIQSFCPTIDAEAIVFRDGITTSVQIPGANVRPVTSADANQIAARNLDTEAKWLLQVNADILGTGGILYHYNRPYGDIFMSVAETHRRRGLGSFLVQELKRICYELGSVPAARCNVKNAASQLTLQKAGFVPCGNIVTGTLDDSLRPSSHRTKQ